MGTWCSGITSAPHAEGPGLNPQCVQQSADAPIHPCPIEALSAASRLNPTVVKHWGRRAGGKFSCALPFSTGRFWGGFLSPLFCVAGFFPSGRRVGTPARATQQAEGTKGAFFEALSVIRNGNVANFKHRAHGVVVSHLLRMRKALGSIPSGSISKLVNCICYACCAWFRRFSSISS